MALDPTLQLVSEHRGVAMSFIGYLFWPVFTLSFGVYLIQHCICAFVYKTQNLKRRYNARWALVTGGSSGGNSGTCSAEMPADHSLVPLLRPAPLLHDACPTTALLQYHPCLAAGIGKALAFKLARQGLNVVLVALGDNLLDTTYDEIKAAFPKLEFRKACWH